MQLHCVSRWTVYIYCKNDTRTFQCQVCEFVTNLVWLNLGGITVNWIEVLKMWINVDAEYPASTKRCYKPNIECLAVNVNWMFCAFIIQYLLFNSSCLTNDQTISQKDGHAMGRIISYRCLHVESRVQSSVCVGCVVGKVPHSGYFRLLCRYHSTSAPYLFMYLSPMLYSVRS